MFANSYFNPRYFADRYWGTGGSTPPPPIPNASEYFYGGIGWQLATSRMEQMQLEKEKRERLRRRKRKVALLLAKLLADSED